MLTHSEPLIDGENLFLATGGVAKVKYYEGKAAYSTDTYALGSTGEVGAEFIYLSLLYQLDYINYNYFLGSGLKHLQKKDIKKHQIKYPSSAEEQEKISTVVRQVDSAIHQAEALIAKYERIKDGLMQDFLTNGIDENGAIRSEKTHEFYKTPLGRIPISWKTMKLGECISAIDPQPDHRTPPTVESGVPYIGISDFTDDGSLDFVNSRMVGTNVLEEQRSKFTIDEGDIVFGKIGTIGKPKLLPRYLHVPYTLSANVILIKPKIDAQFLYWSLLSPYIQHQIARAIHSTSQPAFGMTKIREIGIRVPPAAEANRIGNYLNKVELTIRREKRLISKFNYLKKGICQDLLTGKVRVNQPKSELLAQ